MKSSRLAAPALRLALAVFATTAIMAAPARATGFKAAIEKRTLAVEGTDAAETIILTVKGTPGSIAIEYHRTDGKGPVRKASFALSAFDRLRVNARGGADFVNIVDPAELLDARKKSLNLNGGEGDNIVVATHLPFKPQTAQRLMKLLALSSQVESIANRASGATSQALAGDTMKLIQSSRAEISDVSQQMTKDAQSQVFAPAQQMMDVDGAQLGKIGDSAVSKAEDLANRHQALVAELTKKYDPKNGVYPPDDNSEPAKDPEPPRNRPDPGPEDIDAENTRARVTKNLNEGIQLGASTKADVEKSAAQMERDASAIETSALSFDARLERLSARAEEVAAHGDTDMSAAAGRVMNVLGELKSMEGNLRQAQSLVQDELNKGAARARALRGGKALKKAMGSACDTPITTTNTYTGGSGTDFFFPFSAPNSSWSISGSGGTDFLFGGMAADSIHGGAGTDFICGLSGNDQIHGDAGTDLLFGEFFFDLSFFTGNDCIWGDEGTDLVVGDNFLGYTGNSPGGDDNLHGDDGIDIVVGDDVLPDIFSQSLAGGKDEMEGNDGIDLLLGCGGDDTIDGNDGMDFVQGNGGDDTIDGSGGKSFSFCNTTVELGNLLLGGAGDDTVTGGSGIDVIFGNDGDDTLVGKDQIDVMFGGAGDDKMKGDDGGIICLVPPYDIPIRLGNFMTGGDGNDTITAGGDLDVMLGNKGNDDIRGFDGSVQKPFAVDADVLIGGDGDDYIEGDKVSDLVLLSTDVIMGNAGNDVIDAGKNSDLVAGGAGADTIHGDNNWLPLVGSTDLILGDDGNDWLDGGNSLDVVLGGDGDDTVWGDDETPLEISPDLLFGGAGNDKMIGGCSPDFISGGDGDDNILGDSNSAAEPFSTDFIFCGDGNDRADGGNAMDFIFGGEGDDTLLGDNSTNLTISPDFIFGMGGNDDINGGNSIDFAWGGDGNDKIVGDDQLPTQPLSFDFLFGDDGCDDIYGGRALDVLVGGPGVDHIWGQLGPDLISGGDQGDVIDGGDSLDVIFGNAGNDLIHGGDFIDIIMGGDGNDCLYGDDGQDLIMGDAGDDCIHGGSHADALFGNDGNDLIFGDNGPDFIAGGAGNDRLDGGAASDFLVGGSGSDEAWGGPGLDLMISENRHQTTSSGLDCNCQTEQCPGEICIFKFDDINGNGTQDPGEPGLPGWSFTASGPGGTTTLVTANNGWVCGTFAPGSYSVTEHLQTGWDATTTITQTATVVSKQQTSVRFGNRPSKGKGTLCLTKFNDLNGNGAQDPGEPGLPGWTFTVAGPPGTTTTFVTGADGRICQSVATGTYVVTEHLQGGWTATTAVSQTVPVVANQQANVVFGNWQGGGTGPLCITKFNDLNNNGVQDAGELGISGWNFTVTSASGATTVLTTGASGTVCATYPVGAFQIVEQPQNGWANTTPVMQNVTVTSNGQAAAKFGNRQTAIGAGTLCITKFNDKNQNGVRDAGEPALANWTFTVTPTGGLPGTLVTGTNGTVCATVPAGTYTVTEQAQAGWTNTTPTTLTVNVTDGQQTMAVFGNRPAPIEKGQICVHKFDDKNANGVQDAGEADLPNWSFNVISLDGTITATLVTGPHGTMCGSYPVGDYVVTEVTQDGWIGTTPTTQTVTVTANGQTTLLFGNTRESVSEKGKLCITKFNDKNGNRHLDTGEQTLTGWTFTVTGPNGPVTLTTAGKGTICTTLPAGTYTVTEQAQAGWTNTTPTTQTVIVTGGQETDVIFGNRQVDDKGQLCIHKFNDLNGNGIQDAGEPDLANWSFTVTAPGGGTTTLVTGHNGTMCGSYLVGTYTVTEVAQGGWVGTTPTTQNVTVTANSQTTLLFGNQQIAILDRGKLCITKFNDKNGNRLMDAGEAALAGWTFVVTNANGATVTLVTAANGTVCTTLPAGTYTVAEQAQAGWTNTTVATQTVVVTGGQETDAIFGNRQTGDKGTLCVTKFNDKNGNGIQDAGEATLPNWSFTVTDANGAATTLVTTAIGSICGSFLAGTYVVAEQAQAGWIATTAATQTVAVTPNGHTDVAFGNQRHAVIGEGKLCITKFNDKNGNRIQDGGEVGLPSWTFTVTAADGAVIKLVTTASGVICTSLPAGTYTVTEQPQAGWSATTPTTQTVTVTTNGEADAIFGNRMSLRKLIPDIFLRPKKEKE